MLKKILLITCVAMLSSSAWGDVLDLSREGPQEHEYSPRRALESDGGDFLLSNLRAAEVQAVFSRMQAMKVEGNDINWADLYRGCETRAAYAVAQLGEVAQAGEIGKAFFFGDLRHSWYYHAAIVVETSLGYTVLDPLYSRPLRIEAYIELIREAGGEVEHIVCSPYTFSPLNNCYETEPENNYDRFGYTPSEALLRIQD